MLFYHKQSLAIISCSIIGHYWLIYIGYYWNFLVILAHVIGGYIIIGYWWLFYCRLFGDYIIIDYWWLFYCRLMLAILGYITIVYY
jgi:hypothetical protein